MLLVGSLLGNDVGLLVRICEGESMGVKVGTSLGISVGALFLDSHRLEPCWWEEAQLEEVSIWEMQ